MKLTVIFVENVNFFYIHIGFHKKESLFEFPVTACPLYRCYVALDHITILSRLRF